MDVEQKVFESFFGVFRFTPSIEFKNKETYLQQNSTFEFCFEVIKS